MRVWRRSRVVVAFVCAAATVVIVALAGATASPVRSAPTARASTQAQAPHAAAAAHTRAQKSRAGKQRSTRYAIAYFGDSVSVGYGSSRRGHGYVARVAALLRAHGHRPVSTNHAKGGVPVAYWMYAKMPKGLNAVVVELGTNDVRLGTSSTSFAWAYRTLTSRIRAANPKAQLLCLSVWSHPGGSTADDSVNATIRAVCPGTYVDITRLRTHRYIRSNDGFHPNDAGYWLIAEAVVAKLKLRG